MPGPEPRQGVGPGQSRGRGDICPGQNRSSAFGAFVGVRGAGAALGWGLQKVAKQSGWSFLHPAAAARGQRVVPFRLLVG